ncbi:thymidylate synthase [Rhizobium phage vB_RleS_L338C]|uniref:thymidylate synthase n=1 Tax=Rhizobium phage vB_RleS_L338C TaxID=1414737 RepID=UPI0003D9313B|nr:thymidylate synthase [Rhizobium phage vB_RleS_L338C]AHC30427.1 thymidylate synthase [Rhizobium phage vB_RleS_L338C]
MQYTEPKVILLSQTEVHQEGLERYLELAGAPEWTTDTENGSEIIAEVAGRSCYRSFKEGLNPNVTRVREGNEQYLGNIAKQKHGSVFEHGSATLAFFDVSRIVTHELVRHRPGMAYSQESLRFVRLDALKMYYPRVFGAEFLKEVFSAIDWSKVAEDEGNRTAIDPLEWARRTALEVNNLFRDTVEHLENVQLRLAEITKIDYFQENKFHVKKALTSAFRRLALKGSPRRSSSPATTAPGGT